MKVLFQRTVFLALALIGSALAFSHSVQAMLINGDFETGDLSGWTLFTTTNGTLGNGGDVTSFDTTGSGESHAATFRVGQNDFTFDVLAGGGIYQSIYLAAGSYSLSADIAAVRAAASTNASYGVFDLMFDGVVVDSVDFGFTGVATTQRSVFNNIVVAANSVHEIRLRIQRPFEQDNTTPLQYVDNIVLQAVNTVPVPTTLLLVFMGMLGVAKERSRRASGVSRLVAE